MPGSTASVSQVDTRLLFESAPALFLALDSAFTIVAASDAYLRATMTKRHDILGHNIFDVFPDNPSDTDATGVRNLRASLERVVTEKTEDAMAVQKYDIRRAGDQQYEERYWSPVNYPVLNELGELVYILHRVEDVTEFIQLKNRGAEYAQTAEFLRSRTEQMEVEIFRRAQEIQEVNCQLREAKFELEAKVRERSKELARLNEILRAEMEDRARLEEQYRHAQKMEAIGTLAGGVAHDFNNLLTVISGFSELLLLRDMHVEAQRELIVEIQAASERAASLTRQLLAFSRQQVLQPRILNLNEVLANIDRMLCRLIGEDIRLTTTFGPNLVLVRADPGQIEQIVMNLAVNARDAMPQGGQLTLETASVNLDDRYTESHVDVQPGTYAMLAVSDTGCGMDSATKTRIFEPFFTTKGLGKGSGLGLATVYGIVKQSGGHIWVYSELNKGSTFKVYLPAVQGEKEPVVPASTLAPLGTERILLVEDEEAVRKLTECVLVAQGYSVLSAGTGHEALRMSKSHGNVDLLITDVVMPGMSGRELADLLKIDMPHLKMLFTSGYTDDAVVRHGVLQADVMFLQKPFTPLALARKVREALDLPSEAGNNDFAARRVEVSQ